MSICVISSFYLCHAPPPPPPAQKMLHSVTVFGEQQRQSNAARELSPVNVSQLIKPVNSSLVDFSQPAVTASSFRLNLPSFGSADELSDLRQRDLVGVCVALDVEDEGVFVGVMLDDVIVHVHQDPFFTLLVHFGYPLRRHAVFL